MGSGLRTALVRLSARTICARRSGGVKHGLGAEGSGRANQRPRCQWILDADIRSFFDEIDHDVILSRTPVFRKVIETSLAAGVFTGEAFTPTERGTPQGGEITPPTKVQTSFFASTAEKRGETDSVRHADLVGLDSDTSDECADDLAPRGPVGIVETCGICAANSSRQLSDCRNCSRSESCAARRPSSPRSRSTRPRACARRGSNSCLSRTPSV